jgi:hypothetical protein
MNFSSLESNFFILLLLHIIISFILSYIYGSYLKERFRDKKQNIVFFLFIFNISLPVIGYFATGIITYYLLKVQHEQHLKNVEFLDLNLFETNFVQVHRHFGEGLIQTILLNEYVPTEKKIMALVAISENVSKHNINIVKMGLTTHDDEVRLYAFSILDSLEKDINSNISHNLSEYKNSKDGSQEQALFAKELALLYWELIYYKLSEDTLLDYLLQEVKHYALIAQQLLKEDAKVSFLLGRVYMKEKKYDKALHKFILTTKLDEKMLPFTAPYMCELYFIKRNFTPVKAIMNSTKNLELNTTLYPIVEQWRNS